MKLPSRSVAVATLAGLGVCAVAAGPADASPWGGSGSSGPRDDTAFVRAGHATSLAGDVLLNDPPGTQVVDSTPAAHGTVDLRADGTFGYTPDAGFRGDDTFTYSTSDAVTLLQPKVKPLATIAGTTITGGAYGSAVAMSPVSSSLFYGLTDRGPNVDGVTGGTKVEPLPDFAPAIGTFLTFGDQAILLKSTPLRAKDGTELNGLVNTVADTGETILDGDGNVLPKSPNGYDSEGLAVAKDGTFWVSDEYGPFISHFDRSGRMLSQLSPYDGSLPSELRHREPNKGMEGLTLTPDGTTLVGIMQAALTQADSHAKSKNIALDRIVTVDIKSGATHEYAFLLDDPDNLGTAVSEITAVSATTFLVDERDGDPEPGAYKKLYTVDVSRATDIGPRASVPGATYTPDLGLTVGGKSLEAYFGKDNSAIPAAEATLAGLGITPVSQELTLDLGALVTRLNPAGGFFGHDKVEGIDLFDGGRKLIVSNDSDFGIDGLSNATPPFTFHEKDQPNGAQDDGEYLIVDLSKADDAVQTATVTVHVR